MTPAREGILARLKVDLETIKDSTSPFTNTVGLVSRLQLLPSDLTGEVMPALELLDNGDNEPDALSNNERLITIKWIVVGHYIIEPGQEAATVGNSLFGDIIYAMTAPTYTTHNDTVFHTFDDAHDILPPGKGDTLGMVICNFHAQYLNTWTAP